MNIELVGVPDIDRIWAQVAGNPLIDILPQIWRPIDGSF